MEFRRRKKSRKRTPLREKPLRLPGQSLQEEINSRADRAVEYIVLICLAFGVAMMEWMRWFLKSPPQPILFTFLAIVACSFGTWKLLPIWRELRRLKLGRDGERYVGQCLERLRESGYRVLHDILAENFNIDHVLIGPSGVYTIDTKTISKPGNGECKISYDGKTVSVNGFVPDRDPIVGARAQADWIKQKFLKELISRDLFVRPVVLYPGWYVNEPESCDVWVLNPDRFLGYLKHDNQRLDSRDVLAIESCLSVYVRNFERT